MHYYLIPTELTPADYVNHSCAPNAGLHGDRVLVAIRDIQPGEEICYDYAMTDTSNYDEFMCLCGVTNCRKKVTGQDWRLPQLRNCYKGYMSSYLEKLDPASKES